MFQREVPILEIPEFPYNAVYDMWKEVSIQKMSLIICVMLSDVKLQYLT